MTVGVRSARSGRVLHLTLEAAARRNALSRAMLRNLTSALRTADDGVVAVVISGFAGTFSAGADFRELTGTGVDRSYDDEVAAVTAAIWDSPSVVAAAIEGPCIGAAADIALACDLRIAGRGSHLSIPAVRLGLLYNPAALDRLTRRFPRDTVRRLVLLGERFADDRAVHAGLVSELVARGDAVARTLDRLGDIVTAPDAAAATKAFLNAVEGGTSTPEQWEETRRRLLDSPDRSAAVARARNTHVEEEGTEGR